MRGITPLDDIKLDQEANERLARFFSILLEIDMRINPNLYKPPNENKSKKLEEVNIKSNIR